MCGCLNVRMFKCANVQICFDFGLEGASTQAAVVFHLHICTFAHPQITSKRFYIVQKQIQSLFFIAGQFKIKLVHQVIFKIKVLPFGQFF
jgi:hypothetical protein